MGLASAPVETSAPGTGGATDRWLGVGHAGGADARAGAATATAAALADRTPALLIAFCSDAHDPVRVLTGIADVAAGVPLVGCSTAGEISHERAGDRGIVVAAIGGSGFVAHTAAGHAAAAGLRAAGAGAAAAMSRLDGCDERVLLLLTDGRAGDQNEVIRGVHEVVGSGVPLAGGCAGDGVRMEGTFQLHDDEVLTGAVVSAAIGSDGPIGLGWAHGWRSVGDPVLVTRSTENRVLEIDDQPALDRYLDHFDAPQGPRIDPAEFKRWARVHPLGLARRRTGEQPVRCVTEADFDERALLCTAEVPQGGLAWFMHGDRASILDSTTVACETALSGLGEYEPLGLLAFNCIGRRGVLGERGIEEELAVISGCTAAPLAGLYTYGEIARSRGVNAVHSQTLAVLALG